MGRRHAEGRGALFALLLCTALLGWLLLPVPASAIPAGATVTNISTTGAGTGSPDSRADPRGTITTVTLDGLQQDSFWKAYVGNVTGVLTLDDATGNTIYDWSLTGVNITGEVYAARNGSTAFSNVECANTTIIAAEETFNNMTGSSVDSITNTFNYTLHASFLVGPTTIVNSTCPSTFTYINDTVQANLSESSDFQEVLLQDVDSNLLYVTLIEENLAGFDNSQYDFQLLVAESDVKANPTTYYFFTEIST